MSGDCLFCGRPAEREHHPTGRDAAERYLDPAFKVAVCHDDHTLAHDDWYTFRVEQTPKGATVLHLIEISMRRLGLFCARLGPDGSVWAALAGWFARNAGLLATAIGVLDRHYPGWDWHVNA